LSGRGLCDELITHPEESYRLRCVIVCDLETSKMRRPWPTLDRSATGKNLLCLYLGMRELKETLQHIGVFCIFKCFEKQIKFLYIMLRPN